MLHISILFGCSSAGLLQPELKCFHFFLFLSLWFSMRKACCERKNEKRRGCWSKQEDQKLIDYIHKNGEGSWRSLPQAAGLRRCSRSCRLRWINYLRPNLKHANFGEDEEDLIIRLHALLGNMWSLIAGRLPGRKDNEVKNYWNFHIRKKLIQMGHDPDNLHRRITVNGTANQPFDPKAETCNHVNLHAMKTQVSADSTIDDYDYGDQRNINTLPDLNLDLTLSACSS